MGNMMQESPYHSQLQLQVYCTENAIIIFYDDAGIHYSRFYLQSRCCSSCMHFLLIFSWILLVVGHFLSVVVRLNDEVLCLMTSFLMVYPAADPSLEKWGRNVLQFELSCFHFLFVILIIDHHLRRTFEANCSWIWLPSVCSIKFLYLASVWKWLKFFFENW